MVDEPSLVEQNTNDRAKFFQTIQAWPLSTELNYAGWLNNFSEGEDRDIACLILDFFIHFSKEMINQLLQITVAKAGSVFSDFFSDWKHSDFKNRCIYSFIPGENPHPTDSGNLFSRKLRDVLDINHAQIVNYSDIPNRLSKLSKPTPLIFVDDFVGSGAQVSKAWNKNLMEMNGLKTLKEICKIGGHCAVYTPLIVNQKGYDRIQNYCEGLNLCTVHILGPEYCLFSKECICWKDDEKLFNKGIELILRKNRELGIPSTNGQSTEDEKGFGMQGLAISFEHNPPDAVPAFFYWKAENWIPLLKKHYE